MLVQISILSVPFGSLDKQTINVDAIAWSACHVLGDEFFAETETETELVNWFEVFTRVGLQGSCHETVGEEETREPETWGVPVL